MFADRGTGRRVAAGGVSRKDCTSCTLEVTLGQDYRKFALFTTCQLQISQNSANMPSAEPFAGLVAHPCPPTPEPTHALVCQ